MCVYSSIAFLFTSFFFFFFFQAEDGIRDHCVTGVQTCALPISARHSAAEEADAGRRRLSWRRARPEFHLYPRHPAEARLRSEERRVGKSVDLGGRRIIKKKKKKNKENTE